MMPILSDAAIASRDIRRHDHTGMKLHAVDCEVVPTLPAVADFSVSPVLIDFASNAVVTIY